MPISKFQTAKKQTLVQTCITHLKIGAVDLNNLLSTIQKIVKIVTAYSGFQLGLPVAVVV